MLKLTCLEARVTLTTPDRNTRRSDPETSQLAGERAKGFREGQQSEIIKVMQWARCPLAPHEVNDILGLPPHASCHRRFPELVKANLIEVVPGDYAITPSGSKARRFKLK